MNDFCRLLKSLKEEKDKIFALATIVHVDGSAYRREGAKMLIREDSSYFGAISAGCLEEDLIYQAKDVIDTLQAKTVKYDLRSEDDLSWGQGAGCDGDIEVYIEPIGWNFNKLAQNVPLWPYIDELLNKGISIVSAKCIDKSDTQVNVILYSESGEILGSGMEENLERALNPYISQFLSNGTKAQLIHIKDLNSEFLLERCQPKELLYIFGAGPDAEPLVQLASQLDFSIVLIDPRSNRCNEEIFPNADFRYIEHPHSFFKKGKISSDSFVLVMTHSFTRDQEILHYLLKSPPRYLGVLGPRRRTERLVGHQSLPSFIHSPIGLNIGGEGPEEISVSIVAELIRERNLSDLQNKERNFSCWI